jgi:hypothetical protein
MTVLPRPRVRYPLRAKLGIAAAALAVLAELAVFSLLMMPLIPLIPVFIGVLLGNAFVLADVVHWAASLGIAEAARLPRAEKAAGRTGSRAPQAAHAS